MPKYVIFDAGSSFGGLGKLPDFEGYRQFLIRFGELDPTIVMQEVDCAKAGGLQDCHVWLAFRVKNADVQAVVDAATYTFAEEPIPADEVNLDDHDVVVVNTKDECYAVLNDESMAQFLGI